ncbi:MAG: STAS domain-containing protein [bacterium]|nr:STAS domain-containing protein [bacterium]
MSVIQVSEDIGIKNIKKFYSELSETAKDEKEIVIDLANVKRIDLSFIQVLMNISKQLKGNEQKILLQSVSEKVREQLKLGGIK